MGLRSSITPPKHDLSEYALVVVGTPIWAARLSSPVRTYLSQQRESLERVAFFCTQAGIAGRLTVTDAISDHTAGGERLLVDGNHRHLLQIELPGADGTFHTQELNAFGVVRCPCQ